MQVRPQNCAIYAARCFEQMMVIVPVNTEVKETQHVTQKNRQQRFYRRPIRSMRYLQLQHHDGDDDRQHTVAKCFESVLVHRSRLSTWNIHRNRRETVRFGKTLKN